jgi:hypothetical protein
MMRSILRSKARLADSKPVSMPVVVPLEDVRSIADLSPNPLDYERTAFMAHSRRYDREALREYYLSQPVAGAEVWANYAVNLWEYEHGVEELTSFPWNITIPMTEVCNATCTFCSSPLVPNPKALAVQEVRHFADALRYAIYVSLQGLGEPLAHPQFEEIVEALQQYQNPVAQLEIITNGWLLSGHRWELLKSLRPCAIQVSVNAATDRTHQIAMGSRPGTFDQVVKNIGHVLADPDWRRCLKVSMVITRHSLAEVPQLLDLFMEKGVDHFQFNPLLPLNTPDWGFGRTGQYLDLWCGHLPDAAELVESAAAAIAECRRKGNVVTATPEQWLLPVDPPVRSDLIQLSIDQRNTAVFQMSSDTTEHDEWEQLCVRMDDQRIGLGPHDVHTEITGAEQEGVRFRGTPRSKRWAYLLRTPRLQLGAGEYTLDLSVDIESGGLYAGILDVESDDFVVQEELQSGASQIRFALRARRVVDVVVRQGADDTAVSAVYRSGRLSTEISFEESDEPGVVREAVTENASPAFAAPPDAPDESSGREATMSVPEPSPSIGGPDEDRVHSVSKGPRIYCPMVYSTLSVFHHSLDVSICCYMENAPGTMRSSLKQLPLVQAYNDEGFKLVRRTLQSERHIPVCESCPYGESRS